MPGVHQQHAVGHQVGAGGGYGSLAFQRDIAQVKQLPFSVLVMLGPGRIGGHFFLVFQFGKRQLVLPSNLLVALFHFCLRGRVGPCDGGLLRRDHQGFNQKAEDGQRDRQDGDNRNDQDGFAFLGSTHFLHPPLISIQNSLFRIRDEGYGNEGLFLKQFVTIVKYSFTL